MTGNFSDGTSIYLQIAEMMENDILRGVLEEEGQAPSTNELARAYSINPATAAKGINLLVDEGILYKRRGIGMFVAKGGRQRIMQKRKDAFFETYVKRLVREAKGVWHHTRRAGCHAGKGGRRKGRKRRMNKVLSAQHITKNYGKKQVLHDVSIDIEPGIIYGLIGRNGAGKTTLLSILTAQNTWDIGTVTYGDAPVWENAAALADICFSRELSPMMMFGENTYKVRDYLKAAATYYPYWDEAYAQRLVQRFGLETKKAHLEALQGYAEHGYHHFGACLARAHHHSGRAGGRAGRGGP